MGKLTDEMLNRYVDGELSAAQRARVDAALSDSPTDRRAADEALRIGTLIRFMDEHTASDVSFDGLSDKVLAEIKTTRASLSFTERLQTWLSEFFSYRKGVWVPAAAVVGTACLALLLSPLFGSVPPGNTAGSEIVLHAAGPVSGGSRIASVDFGDADGRKFTLDDGSGQPVGVVWIMEGE